MIGHSELSLYTIYVFNSTIYPPLNTADRCHHYRAYNTWMTSLTTHDNFKWLLLSDDCNVL